jgi:hypothetical protein
MKNNIPEPICGEDIYEFCQRLYTFCKLNNPPSFKVSFIQENDLSANKDSTIESLLKQFFGQLNGNDTRDERLKRIGQISNDDLLIMCGEIYDYNNVGEICDGLLKNLYKKHTKDYYTLNSLVDDVLNEAQKRFSKIVKLLLLERPRLYIKK